jgi:hypothetical protein
VASVKDLKVGQRGTYRGRAGELLTVDQPTQQVVFRHDLVDPVVSADGVRGPAQLADVTISAAEFEPAPVAKADETMTVTRAKAAVPTKAQIEAARHKAAMAGKAEGLKGQKLEDVQDEAEAELVSKMARGLDV